MKKVNLRSYYSLIYPQDTFVDVSDDVASLLHLLDRDEHAYYERRRINKAYYSLDADSHIDQKIVFVVLSPQDLYDQKLERNALFSAILALPYKQKNVSAPVFLWEQALLRSRELKELMKALSGIPFIEL